MVSRSHAVLKSTMTEGVWLVSKRRTSVEGAQSMREPKDLAIAKSKYRNVCIAFWVYMGFIAIGTLYFGVYNTCACPAGVDCDEAYDMCEETGGRERNVIDGLYMAVITLTTVGFGDESPSSQTGRIFCTVW